MLSICRKISGFCFSIRKIWLETEIIGLPVARLVVSPSWYLVVEEPNSPISPRRGLPSNFFPREKIFQGKLIQVLDMTTRNMVSANGDSSHQFEMNLYDIQLRITVHRREAFEIRRDPSSSPPLSFLTIKILYDSAQSDGPPYPLSHVWSPEILSA